MKQRRSAVVGFAIVMAMTIGCSDSAHQEIEIEEPPSVVEPLSTSATVAEMQPNVQFGGRAVAGTVSASNASVAFIATDSGGVFKTTNGGTGWSFVSGLSQMRMSDVKIDPRDTTVVIATSHDDDHVASQAGIWRSANGGGTFARVALAVPNCPRYSAEGIAFAPDVDDVFVGIRCNSSEANPGFRQGGLAVSRDKGATFTFLDLGLGLGSVVAQAGGLVDVYGSEGHKRSTNRGAGFGSLHTTVPGTYFSVMVNALAVSPLNTNVLFATTVNDSGGVRGARVFESDDAGVTWRTLPFSQTDIAREPSVSTRNVGGQVKLYFGNGRNEYRQTCTGTSPVGSCQGADLTRQLEFLSFDHSDTMGVVFGPSGNCPLYAMADSGVLKTTDANCLGPWTTVRAGSSGFNALQIFEVAGQVHSSHLDLYFGTQDNQIWGSPDGGATWPNTVGPEGGLFSVVHSTPNDTDPNNFVTFNSIGSNNKMTPHMQQFASWLDASSNAGSLQFAPFVVQPNVYLQWSMPTAGNFVLNITTNGSSTWKAIPGTALQGDITRQMWISGPPSNPTVYQPVIRSNGTVGLVKIVNVRSTQATLTHIDSALSNIATYCEVFYCPVPAFAADPSDPTHLIVGDVGTNQMKVSRDGGATWTVDTALTNAVTAGGLLFSSPSGEFGRGGGTQARAISFNPADGRQVMVGTASNGVIASSNGGTSWFNINGSTQIRNITSFVWDEARRNVIVSTFGRGLFKITDNDGAAPAAPTGLVATAGNAQIMLKWNASSGATGYNVKRSATSGGPYTTVGSPTTPLYVDTSAANGTTFFYVVSATSPESANSAQASATPSASTCKTATGGASGVGSWINTSFASQSGTFTAEYDGTPSAVLDSTISMSKGIQTTFTGFATLTRFNTSGNIDARNGGAYAANVTLPYSGGNKYHFRVAVNVPSHTYSIFVTPPTGTEQTIGTNFAFRNEQNMVTSLDNWGVQVNKTGTTITNKVCNFWVHP